MRCKVTSQKMEGRGRWEAISTHKQKLNQQRKNGQSLPCSFLLCWRSPTEGWSKTILVLEPTQGEENTSLIQGFPHFLPAPLNYRQCRFNVNDPCCFSTNYYCKTPYPCRCSGKFSNCYAAVLLVAETICPRASP